MLWIVRAGMNSKFFSKFLNERKVFLPWNGYKVDLSNYKSIDELKDLVKSEKKTSNRTSLANWSGQLNSFVHKMKISDYVLIPSKNSKTYCLGRIAGNYIFNENEADGLYHSRDINLILIGFPKDLFPINIQYSLGAYRTVFMAKSEEAILEIMLNWKRHCNDVNIDTDYLVCGGLECKPH